MNRVTSRFFATLGVLLCGGSGVALAQPPVPGGVGGGPRPTYSPYLNLLRQGSPAINYYGIVRPELQFRQQLQNLQGGLAANQQAIGDLQAGPDQLTATGHPIQYLNHGVYFLNNTSGQGMAGFGARPGAVGGGVRPLQQLGTPTGPPAPAGGGFRR